MFVWLWVGIALFVWIVYQPTHSLSTHLIGSCFTAMLGWYPTNVVVKYLYYVHHNERQDKAAARKRSRLP